MAPKMAGPLQGQSVLHSPPCEHNREPILAMALPQLLAGAARVLRPLADGAMPANNLTLIFQLEELPCEAASCRTRRRSKQV